MKVIFLLSCLLAFAAAYVPCGNPCSSGGCQSNCGETYMSGCTSGCPQYPYNVQPFEQYGSNQLFSSLFSGSYGRNQPKPMVNPSPYYDQNAIYGGNTMLRNPYESVIPSYNPIGAPLSGGLDGGYSPQFSTYGGAGSAGYEPFAPHTGFSGYDSFAPHAGQVSNFDPTSYTLHPTIADVYKNTRGVKAIKYKKEKLVRKEVQKETGETEEEEEEEDEENEEENEN